MALLEREAPYFLPFFKKMNILPYLNFEPKLGNNITAGEWVSIIGRTTVGDNCHFGNIVTLRADGESIAVGDDCWFAESSTVHIADSMFGTTIKNNVTIGRYALVHACEIGDNCVLGEHAVVMDNAVVGSDAVICANSVVPPGKKLEGGWVYSGVPAKPRRQLEVAELEKLRQIVKSREKLDGSELVLADNPVKKLLLTPGEGVVENTNSHSYVAPTASITGDLTLEKDSSIWFGVEINASGGSVVLGEASNIQDNSRLYVKAGEQIKIGKRVTIGHNVQLHACEIEDGCIIGMGSTLSKGTIVKKGGVVAAGAVTEPDTIVAEGMIWSGNPARQSRALSEENARLFSIGVDVYKTYTQNYNKLNSSS